MVRTIDDLGRLNIPRELRDELNWPVPASVVLSVEGDVIVARLSKEEGCDGETAG